MVRLGRISYVNMAPVFHRLNVEVEEVSGVPTELNAMLLDGQHAARCQAIAQVGQRLIDGVARSMAKLSSGFRITRAADDAAGLIAHVDPRGAHVVGASLGAMVAQEVAVTRPDRIERLVLLADVDFAWAEQTAPAATIDARSFSFALAAGVHTELGRCVVESALSVVSVALQLARETLGGLGGTDTVVKTLASMLVTKIGQAPLARFSDTSFTALVPGLSAFGAITMFGLVVTGIMGVIRRWHASNCVRYKDEVDHLLALARSDKH